MKHRLSAINTGLAVEATVSNEGISGVGGHVFPRLRIPISLDVKQDPSGDLQNLTQAVSFGMLSGELVVGQEKIGDIRPVSVDQAGMHYRPYQTKIPLCLEIPFDSCRIEWLEQMRAGKSMAGKLIINLSVQIFGMLSNSNNPSFKSQVGLLQVSNIQGEIPFTVPDTHWREQVLPALGYGKVLAIELPAISPDACKALVHSFNALENARNHFARGLYDDAVAACRVALDPFFEQVDKGDGSGKTIPKLKSSWEVKLGKATYDWLDCAFGAVKERANKPHHSPNSHFDRLGAQMLLMVTMALIAYAAQSTGT